MSVQLNTKPISVPGLQKMKRAKEKISMLTAYDYTTAKILDEAGVELLLVGDSAANVMAGHNSTLPISLDQMIYHAQCVVRGVKRALVVVDMPFGSYQGNPQKALETGIRIMKESNANAVKLEGGEELLQSIQLLTQAGIPVMGHLGLTPQSVHQLGGYGLQGKDEKNAERLKNDAHALQKAGCFALVLEKIPALLATEVSQELDIPTIGIGAGNGCDGQVLVFQDMVGMNKDFSPKFLRRYLDLHSEITHAVQRYIHDVKTGDFPNEDEQY